MPILQDTIRALHVPRKYEHYVMSTWFFCSAIVFLLTAVIGLLTYIVFDSHAAVYIEPVAFTDDPKGWIRSLFKAENRLLTTIGKYLAVLALFKTLQRILESCGHMGLKEFEQKMRTFFPKRLSQVILSVNKFCSVLFYLAAIILSTFIFMGALRAHDMLWLGTSGIVGSLSIVKIFIRLAELSYIVNPEDTSI